MVPESTKYYAARFSEGWGPVRWAVFSPVGVRVREFPDDSRESGIAANKLAKEMSQARESAK